MYLKLKIKAYNSFGSNFIHCEKNDVENFDEVKEAILKRLGNITEMSNISKATLKEKSKFRKGIIKAKDCKGILHAASLTDRWRIETLEFENFSSSEILNNKEKFKKDSKNKLIQTIIDNQLQNKNFVKLEIANYYPLNYYDIVCELNKLNLVHCKVVKSDDYEMFVKIL